MKRLLGALLLLLVLGGCTNEIDLPEILEPSQSSESETVIDEQTLKNNVILYIGTREWGFEEYPYSYEGELTPEILIDGIEKLTDWDITLADRVTTGKGGMTVCFEKSASLFVGPPSPQKDEFFTHDLETFSKLYLGSIKKTLQMGFTGEGGNPDNIDIYYCCGNNEEIVIPVLDELIPIDVPYPG